MRLRDRTTSARRIARYALPLMLVDGGWVLFSQIDLLLIGAYLGTRQVGLFSAPLRLLTLLAYPGIAVADGVANRMTRGAGSEPDGAAFAGALRVLIIIESLVLAPMIVWARPIVDVLLGSGYRGSTDTLRVLSISAYLGAFAPLVSVSANFLGDARSRVPLMLGAAALDGAIDVVLIPRIGIISGAIATGAALALMDLGHIRIVRRHVTFPLAPLMLSVARGLLAAAAMAAVLLIVGTNHSIPVLILGGALGIVEFAAALVLVGEISLSELGSARRWAAGHITFRA
jgi:O-antigen/teichoic acid export membrane protein